MSIRTLIVDDEPAARKRLARLLSSATDVEIVGEADNGLAALEAIDHLKPDLVFLDIEMPELGGLEVARTLSDGPRIVFATAFDEHALAAFDAAAVDYLVKPIARDRLERALDKIRRTPGPTTPVPTKKADRFAVRCGNRYLVFAAREVSAVVARDHYALLIVGDKELLSEEPLDQLVRRLDDRFLRVHRSGIINLDFLRELRREGDRKYSAVLGDRRQTKVPVSRDRLKPLKTRLGLG